MAHALTVRVLLASVVALVGWIGAHTKEQTAPRPGWAMLVNVDRAGAEDALLEQAFNQVTGEGVDSTYAAAAIGKLNQYVDGLTSQHITVALCLGMVVDAVEAANGAKWSSQDAARLLVALQKTLDSGREQSLPMLQQAIANVREGKPVGEILTTDGKLVHRR